MSADIPATPYKIEGGINDRMDALFALGNGTVIKHAGLVYVKDAVIDVHYPWVAAVRQKPRSHNVVRLAEKLEEDIIVLHHEPKVVPK